MGVLLRTLRSTLPLYHSLCLHCIAPVRSEAVVGSRGIEPLTLRM